MLTWSRRLVARRADRPVLAEAALRMLARLGIAAELRYGVGRKGEADARPAHTWVATGGEVIPGGEVRLRARLAVFAARTG